MSKRFIGAGIAVVAGVASIVASFFVERCSVASGALLAVGIICFIVLLIILVAPKS